MNFMKQTMVGVAAAIWVGAMMAADGTWAVAQGGAWSAAANWASGTVADGSDSTATFPALGIAAATRVTVDTARVIGHIVSDASAGGVWRFEHAAGGPLTFQTTSGTPSLNNVSNVNFSVPLAGTQGLQKSGAGVLILAAGVTNTMTGAVTLQEGTLQVNGGGSAVASFSGIEALMNNTAVKFNQEGAEYTCPLSISGYGALPSVLGAALVEGNALNVTLSGLITVRTNVGTFARVGQYGVGGSLDLRGPVSGEANLELFAQAASADHWKYFHVRGENSFRGFIMLTSYAASSHTTLHGNSVIPAVALYMNSAVFGGQPCHLILELNDTTNVVVDVLLLGEGAKIIRNSGARLGGMLYATNTPPGNPYSLQMINPCTLRIEGAQVILHGYGYVRDNGQLVVSGGYLHIGLEFMPGHSPVIPGSTGFVSIVDGGVLNAYVTRLGDNGAPGVMTVASNGVLETSALYTYGGPCGSQLYVDGGVVGDGGYPQWDNRSNWLDNIAAVQIGTGGIRFDLLGERMLMTPVQRHASIGSTPDAGLVKTGGGTLILSNINDYTGPTIISNGTLAFALPGALPAVSPYIYLGGGGLDASGLADATLIVTNGRALDGNGTIIGSLRAGGGGSVAPGPGINTLATTSNITLESGAVYNWGVAPGGLADLLQADGALTLPAEVNSVTVHVNLAGAGDESNTFILCNAAAVSGSPDALYLEYGATGISGPAHPESDGSAVYVNLLLPEPGLAALLGGPGACWWLRRRRTAW